MTKTLPVAKALLFNVNNEFLLLKRSETHPRLAGFYDLPGGMIEPNEDIGAGLTREIKEETGLVFAYTELRVLYAVTKLMNGKSYPTLLYGGRVQASYPEIMISWEHQSYEWAPLARLKEVEPHLAPTYQEALNYILHHGIVDIESGTYST